MDVGVMSTPSLSPGMLVTTAYETCYMDRVTRVYPKIESHVVYDLEVPYTVYVMKGVPLVIGPEDTATVVAVFKESDRGDTLKACCLLWRERLFWSWTREFQATRR